MGYKVTIRKNGKTHGETHYPAEALAVGAAQKMRNAGAGVATTVERCNPGCLGCNGMASNPKSKPKEPPVWEREGHSQRNPRRNGKKFKMPPKPPANAEAVAAARAVGRTAYARGIGSAPAQDPMLRPLISAHPNDFNTIIGIMDAWKKEWEKAYHIATDAEVAKLGIFPKSNPRRNGNTDDEVVAAALSILRSARGGKMALSTFTARMRDTLGGFSDWNRIAETGRIELLRPKGQVWLRYHPLTGADRRDEVYPPRRNGTSAANIAAAHSLARSRNRTRHNPVDPLWKAYLRERATHSTWLLSTSGLAEGSVVKFRDNGVVRRALVIRAAPGFLFPERAMIFQSANILRGKGRGPRHGALADLLA
jgi:hypothetical protein